MPPLCLQISVILHRENIPAPLPHPPVGVSGEITVISHYPPTLIFLIRPTPRYTTPSLSSPENADNRAMRINKYPIRFNFLSHPIDPRALARSLYTYIIKYMHRDCHEARASGSLVPRCIYMWIRSVDVQHARVCCVSIYRYIGVCRTICALEYVEGMGILFRYSCRKV